jgi:hypothetical protein
MAGSDKKQSPVSHTVVVSVLPSAGFSARIEATEDQKAALAEAHDLLAVDSFIAELELKRWRRDGVRIRGNVQARIRQECVVTLEPLVTDLDVPVDAVFLPEGSKLARPLDEEGALIVDPDGPRPSGDIRRRRHRCRRGCRGVLRTRHRSLSARARRGDGSGRRRRRRRVGKAFRGPCGATR